MDLAGLALGGALLALKQVGRVIEDIDAAPPAGSRQLTL